jgi:hypothetical protein
VKRVAACIALATLISTGCKSPMSAHASGSCPPFPSTQVDQKGGAFASTSLGAMVRHAPPAHHVDLPAGPIGQVRIVLERSGCFGSCPSYRVELGGNGEVLFHGDGFVTFPGDHKSSVSPLVIQCLLNDFRLVDFWSLDREYVANVTDLPTYKISLTIGGKTKVLTDYAGRMVDMPLGVTVLEEAIDQAAGSDAWITGNARTIPGLESEHFDFHGRAAANLFVTASEDAPDAIVFALLDHGVPLDGLASGRFGDERISAVEAAAMNGRIALVRRLIGAGVFSKGGKALVSATLRASVASQRADMVAEILKYQPDVNSPDKHGDTALALVFTGAHPRFGEKGAPDEDAAIIRMLGKAGANPDLPNSGHENLLNLAYSRENKDALLAIGAHRQKPSVH